jgi:hypothetical protein
VPRRIARPTSSETKITTAIDQAWMPATWAKALATSTPDHHAGDPLQPA